MKVAVTGASGFVGRHVMEELGRQSVEVIAVTRDKTRCSGFSSNVRIVEMDISQPSDMIFAQLERPDVLIHLAWDGLPNYKSLHHFEVELPKHYYFLKKLIESGLSSLVVAGTCFEYGMQSGSLSEERKTNPVNPYGYAKDALHRQLDFLKILTPYRLIWGRLFYLYGEGQPVGSLYSQFLNTVLRREPEFNMSGGEQLRDYLPVSIAAHLLVRLALTGNDLGSVNICSGNPISVRCLVEQWLHDGNLSIHLNLGHFTYPDYEPLAFWGDSKKLMGLLGGYL